MTGKVVEDKRDVFSTTDLSLVSYLTLKVNPLDLIKGESGKVTFYFHDTEELGDMVDEFYGNTAQVNPLEYFNSLKNNKTRIYQL